MAVLARPRIVRVTRPHSRSGKRPRTKFLVSFELNHEKKELKTDPAKRALSAFLTRFLSRLQELGTVPAIDYENLLAFARRVECTDGVATRAADARPSSPPHSIVRPPCGNAEGA